MRTRLNLLILGWLRFWAKLQLKKYAPDIVGITGSAGKTSAKEAVYAVLKDKYVTKKTDKANSESGIPLDILNITPFDYSWLDWLRMVLLCPWKFLTRWEPHEKYVVEMGIDSPTPPKNMEYLLTIILPRTAIYLNALPVHTAFFDKKDPVEAIAMEKGKLIEGLPDNGLAILNAGDPNVWPFKDKTKAQVMGFGKTEGMVRVSGWRLAANNTEFEFRTDEETATVALPYLLPEHFGLTLAAALCVALDEDFTLKEGCVLIQKNYRLPPGRASLFEGRDRSTIIDSSYNASPQTMLDMLDLLHMAPGKRKIALLGDMRELGEDGDEAHVRVAQKAQAVADSVYLVGPLMQKHALPYFESQAEFKKVRWFANAQAAGEAIGQELKRGDVILVKGSQNTIFLEAAVELLLARKKDVGKLCRRGDFWERQRRITVG